jgi:hypothetical protein
LSSTQSTAKGVGSGDHQQVLRDGDAWVGCSQVRKACSGRACCAPSRIVSRLLPRKLHDLYTAHATGVTEGRERRRGMWKSQECGGGDRFTERKQRDGGGAKGGGWTPPRHGRTLSIFPVPTAAMRVIPHRHRVEPRRTARSPAMHRPEPVRCTLPRPPGRGRWACAPSCSREGGCGRKRPAPARVCGRRTCPAPAGEALFCMTSP